MNTTTAIPGQPRRWVHAANRILPVLPAASGALTLASATRWKPGMPGIVLAFTSSDGGGSGAWLPARIALTAVTVVAVLGYLAHSRTPCLACAARFPLNPQAAAERRRRQLRTAHVLLDIKLFRVCFVLLWLPLLVPTGWPLNAAYLLLGAAGAVFLLSLLTHSALQPWCPWCGHGGGGEVTPAPVPGSGRGLPVNA